MFVPVNRTSGSLHQQNSDWFGRIWGSNYGHVVCEVGGEWLTAGWSTSRNYSLCLRRVYSKEPESFVWLRNCGVPVCVLFSVELWTFYTDWW